MPLGRSDEREGSGGVRGFADGVVGGAHRDARKLVLQ